MRKMDIIIEKFVNEVDTEIRRNLANTDWGFYSKLVKIAFRDSYIVFHEVGQQIKINYERNN